MKKLKWLIMWIILIFSLKLNFSTSLNLPNLIIKGDNISFWFDMYSLIAEKTNFLENSTLIKSLTGYCKISNNKASLELEDQTVSMLKYKLTANDYGYFNITCYAKAINEKDQVFEANITKQILVADNPSVICNPSDINIGWDNYGWDYLYDIITASYKYFKTHQKAQIGSPLEITVDFSHLIGKIKNPILSCSLNETSYNISFLISQNYQNDNIFNPKITFYLQGVPQGYIPSVELDCTFKAYCDFYGSQFSRNIQENFSIIIPIRPLNQSTFYLISNKALQKLTKEMNYYKKLAENYSIRASLQQLETYESPFWAGIPGLIIDYLLNPFLVLIHQLFSLFSVAPSAATCPCTIGYLPPLVTFCNPLIGSGVLCVTTNLVAIIPIAKSCSISGEIPTSCTTTAALATGSVAIYEVYRAVGWLPMFFTTFFSERTLGLTMLTTCDPAKKWVYDITAHGLLFAVLNILRYPPIIPSGQELQEINKLYDPNKGIQIANKMTKQDLTKLQNFQSALKNAENFKVSEAQFKDLVDKNFGKGGVSNLYNAISKTYGAIKSPFEKLKSIMLAPLDYLTRKLLGKTLEKIFEQKICPNSVVSQFQDNVPMRSIEMLSDFLSIYRGVASGSYSSITVTLWGKLIAIIFEIVSYNLKSKEQCIVFNTLYPLSMLGKKDNAIGIRAELKESKNNIDIKVSRSVSSREYWVCPQQVGGALSSYLSLLANNQKCLLSALNWFYFKQINSSFNGDLISVMQNNLPQLMYSYSFVDTAQLKFTPLLTNYNSIKDLAYCGNIRKYLNCLFEESVKACQRNKWKVNFLYLAKFAGTIYADAFANIITKTIYSFVVEKFPDFCGISSTFKTIIQILQTIITFYQAKKGMEDAEKCVKKTVNKIHQLYNQTNLTDIEKLNLNIDCNKNKGNFFNTVLSLVGTLLSPSNFDSYLENMINAYINNMIEKLIKIGSERCSIPKDNFDGSVIALDTILNVQIDANQILGNLMPNVISTSLFALKVSGSKTLKAQIYYSQCENPSNEEIAKYCYMINKVYPFPESSDRFCIYEITKENKTFNLTIYGRYQQCRIYLVGEKAENGYIAHEKRLIKQISCNNIVSTSLTPQDFENAANSLGEVEAYYLSVVPVNNNQELQDETVSSLVNPTLWNSSSYYVEYCPEENEENDTDNTNTTS